MMPGIFDQLRLRSSRSPRWPYPLLALLGGLSGAVRAQTAPAGVTAIVGATLWDGRGGPALSDAVVTVQNGRILCAGTRRGCPIPAGATRVAANGSFLLPGLIDTHVHLLFRRAGVTSGEMRGDLHELLADGITTVRDMGNNPLPLREEVAAAGPAPRVLVMQLVAGVRFFQAEVERGSGATSILHAPAATGMRQLGWWPLMFGPGNSADAVVANAREVGAVGLKLYQGLTQAQVAALVRSAHAVGMTVWGHAWVQPASVLEQAQAGQDGVVHAAGLVGELLDRGARDSFRNSSALLAITADSASPESALRPAILATLDSLAARGTFLEPTLHAALLSAVRANNRNRPVPTLSERYARAANAFGVVVTREAVRRGVRITAGTDHTAYGPANDRPRLTEELRLLVDSAGMTPPRALLAATRDAALALGPPGTDLGTIVAGKVADLVLLSADPLADIGNVKNVEWVMLGGVLYRPAELHAM